MKEFTASVMTILITLLHEIRIQRNITQAEIADYLGISLTTWNKIENYKAQVSVGQLYKLCERFQVNPNQIIYLVDCYVGVLLSYNFNCRLSVIKDKKLDDKDDLQFIMLEYYDSEEFSQNRTNFGYLSAPHQPLENVFSIPHFDVNLNDYVCSPAFYYLFKKVFANG